MLSKAITPSSAANCCTDLRVGGETTFAMNVPSSVWRANTWLVPATNFARHIPSWVKLHQSSPYSVMVLPCTCTGFWNDVGLWQTNLFAETITVIPRLTKIIRSGITFVSRNLLLAETWFPLGFYRKSFNSFWMLPTIKDKFYEIVKSTL